MLVYIVEDDKNICEIESYALSNAGYKVEAFYNGSTFLKQCKEQVPDIVLLDIMLPFEDGLTILSKIRSSSSMGNIPVILITAKSTELDKVKGLEQGADDYITKPFGVMELVSRVKAVLRRTNKLKPKIKFGELSIDYSAYKVEVEGVECVLTHKEFELLRYLVENQGMVLSRNQIMDSVWGTYYVGETRTVDMHIKTLRKKLGRAGEMIRTVRNVGYKFESEK